MNTHEPTAWIAFAQGQRIASGTPREVATQLKRLVDAQNIDELLIFDARTSLSVEIDLRGPLSALLERLPASAEPQATSDDAPPAPAVGRPRLGVTAREITLLPRHWDWLATQPGGASVTLRKLVEQALRCSKKADQLRQAQDATYRFMSVIGGDNAGFEEAARALFAGDRARLQEHLAPWPDDVRNHALALADAVFKAQ